MQTLTKFSSPYNWLSSSNLPLKKSDRIQIHDLTLDPDAEEMAGVTISENYKITVAKALSKILAIAVRTSSFTASRYPSATGSKI